MIMYYAFDGDMGDTSPDDCKAFRKWAHEQLSTEYPGEFIDVVNAPSLEQVIITDNETRREEIIEFCARLWDRCPWNFDA